LNEREDLGPLFLERLAGQAESGGVHEIGRGNRQDQEHGADEERPLAIAGIGQILREDGGQSEAIAEPDGRQRHR